MHTYIMSRRTQITLTDGQYARLKQESEHTGLGLAELVRRALTTAYGSPGREEIEEALSVSFGRRQDRELDGAAYVDTLR